MTKKPRPIIISVFLCGVIGLWYLIEGDLSFAIWWWLVGVSLWKLWNWARICVQLSAIYLLLFDIFFRIGILIFSERHGLFLLGGDLPVRWIDIAFFALLSLPLLFSCAYFLFIMNRAAVKSLFRKENWENWLQNSKKPSE